MKNYFADTMTQELAEFIKKLRFNKDPKAIMYSWRRVAEIVYKEFNLTPSVCSGDQMDGKELCNAAQDWFNEKDEDGWN